MATASIQWIEIGFSFEQRPHLKHVLKGIEAYARRQPRWRLNLKYYFPMTPLRMPEIPTHGLIGGVPNPMYLEQIHRRNKPTVLVNAVETPDWACNVRLDYAELGRLAVSHYTKQGIRKLGWLGSPHPERMEHRRYLQGVQAEADRLDLDLMVFLERPPDNDWKNYANQERQWVQWLKKLPRNTGVICADDEFAARIYQALRHTNLKVGRDIYLLGSGNEEHFCVACSPELSSMQLRYFEVGWQAAELMNKQLRARKRLSETRVVGDPILITRQSSQPTGSGDIASRALAVIWDRVSEGITVDQVARHVAVNPRQLHRLVHEKTGTSPSAEIQRARVETAKRLLVESAASAAEIAAECGYADQAHMSRAVKLATGKTPTQFRRLSSPTGSG